MRIKSPDSLKKRMRQAQVVLVVLMLIPALLAITMVWRISQDYHGAIERIADISDLRPVIQSELLTEIMDVVSGRKRFIEGRQYETLQQTNDELTRLIDSNTVSGLELEVSRRLLGTMRSYVDELGQSHTVDAQIAVNDEINNVAMLFLDMLQEAVNAEINASKQTSEEIQHIVRAMLLAEGVLLTISLVFAWMTQSSLSKAIRVPLDRLEQLAGRIAGGELSVRAQDANVEELRALTKSLNTMAFKLERLIEENRREQDNLKKSELRALQAQITPHFLYNTLDAIVWLAEAGEADQVIDITSALSDFYRISLNNGKDWVTIEEEWEHLKGYLTIQEIRYRDILRYELDIDEALKPHQMLKLLIQPLVENAIYHGIKNRRNGGTVRVTARKSGDRLNVTVEDSGVGMAKNRLAALHRALMASEWTEAEAGYGLYSVDKRIKLYYGQPEGLVIESIEGEGTRVGFTVPLKEDAAP